MTMFASINSLRFNTDPARWIVNGERMSSPPFWEPGRVDDIKYAPRAEYITTQSNCPSLILDAVREGDTSDMFGLGMAWLFAICDYLTFVVHAPTEGEWGYRPAMGGADDQAYEYRELVDMFDGVDPADQEKMLRHAGIVLDRLVNMCRLAGTDY